MSFSLTERSWDSNISTPEETAHDYQLAVFCSSLVLIGGQSKDQQKSHRVWVLEGNEWNPDVIPPVPVGDCDDILSVAGYDHLLFVLYRQNSRSSTLDTPITYRYYDTKSKQWQTIVRICIFPESVGFYQQANIIIHDSNMYVMISGSKKAFFRGHISFNTPYNIEFKPLKVLGGGIHGSSYFTILGNNLITAAFNGRNIKLYTPFEDANKTTSLVDIGELNLEFQQSLYGIIGLCDGSLIAIGEVEDSGSAVVQFKSKGS